MSKLNIKLIKKIHQDSSKIRIVEEIISKEYKKNRMRCPTHLSIGQEVVAATAGNLSIKKDYFISYHRSHAHYLSKGGDVKKFIHELHGLNTGCSKGLGGSMHLVDLKKNFYGSTAIVSSSIPVGIGLALSKKLSNEKGFVFIFIGDASIEEGVFFESLNYVILKNLPVIFICENNSYSVYTHIVDRQPPKRKIHKLISAFGIKTAFANQSRVISMISTLKKTIEYSRKYKKPSFIEIKNFRYLEHCGPNYDDHLNYRNKQDLYFWKKNDALNILENYILRNRTSKFNIENMKNNFSIKIKKIFEKIYNNKKSNKINLKKFVLK